ncbi:MAG: AmmeMemoRadiSam system radical SAM enzyme [Calditrichota bacterium]
MPINRRIFLKTAMGGALCAGGAGLLLTSPSWLRWLHKVNGGDAQAASKLEELIRQAPPARYWVASDAAEVNCLLCHTAGEVKPATRHIHKKLAVRCQLCARECLIEEGKRGKCLTRINSGGMLKTLVYGRPITIHVDPIEKKPFYHFLPGAAAFSFATSGCPLSCKFCQNWEISQTRPEDYQVSFTPPENMVQSAKRSQAPVIAYTYNEPTVFMEYLTDVARVGKKYNLRSVLVSCGYMKEAPLAEMCEVLDAIKIDLKGFSVDFYQRVCSAELIAVLRSIKQVARSGKHLELVNLVVPTLNDSDRMLNDLADWVMGELGPEVPVHFTRFHPEYRMLNLPPTPVATLEKARDIAMQKGIRYAYVGNVPGHLGNHTYCPQCQRIVIKRSSFLVEENHLSAGACEYCGTKIAGVWS